MERCDVLVVGAGPAGSTCARRLSETGLDVLLVDRARFPRDKPCAGWVTPPVLETLGVDRAAYAAERTLQEFRGFRVGFDGVPDVEIDYGRVVSFGIRRCELDHFLLESCGARVIQGFDARDLRRVGADWVVEDRIRTPLLIGAGGHFCPVARLLADGKDGRVIAAREIELPIDAALRKGCRVRPERPEIRFASDLSGYGWLVRKGDFLNVGFGARGMAALPARAERFVAQMERLRRVPTLTRHGWKGHAYLSYDDSTRSVVGEGAVLVGDAAGLAEAQSGEGIRTAVESGLLAAETILAANGRYARDALLSYARALRAHLGNKRRGSWLTRSLTARFGPALLRRQWFVRRFVLDRWFLGLHRGSLLGLEPVGGVEA